MRRNLNFIHTNTKITIGIYIKLYEILLENYQISLATILGKLLAYILACIFIARIQLGKNYQPAYLQPTHQLLQQLGHG